jgi:hypothetical protein
MEAELGLDRAEHLVDIAGKDYLIELPDHLPWLESSEIAPLHAGRAGGFEFGDFGKIGTGFDLGLELQALGFGINENVTCSSSRHGDSLKNVKKSSA